MPSAAPPDDLQRTASWILYARQRVSVLDESSKRPAPRLFSAMSKTFSCTKADDEDKSSKSKHANA